MKYVLKRNKNIEKAILQKCYNNIIFVLQKLKSIDISTKKLDTSSS